MKYRFIHAHRDEFEVNKTMCRVLGVSRSGYYAWQSRPPSQRAQANQELVKRIKQIHRDGRQGFTSRRMGRIATCNPDWQVGQSFGV